MITVHDRRLLAFAGDEPGVFLMPTGEQTFRPMMTEDARVAFEGVVGRAAPGSVFEQAGKAVRILRVS